MQELRADGAAVSVAQALKNFADGQRRFAMQRRKVHEQAKFAFREAVKIQFQFRRARMRCAQRIYGGNNMAAIPIILDKLAEAFA